MLAIIQNSTKIAENEAVKNSSTSAEIQFLANN